MSGSVTTRDARLDKFRGSPEAEARILLLIDAFSRKAHSPRELEGRVKLAKLDFLRRYPQHLARVMALRGESPEAIAAVTDIADSAPIDNRMMRYRYGPWDPSYYALLGSLVGRSLVVSLPLLGGKGAGYRTTERGQALAYALSADDSFSEIVTRAKLLRRYFDLSGTTLQKLLYELPEIADALWNKEID